jgi:hypothetical protein
MRSTIRSPPTQQRTTNIGIPAVALDAVRLNAPT